MGGMAWNTRHGRDDMFTAKSWTQTGRQKKQAGSQA
jgi:hypothetical protein